MNHSAIEAFAEAFANAPRLAELEVRSPQHGSLRLRRSLLSAERKPRPIRRPVAPLVAATSVGVTAIVAPPVSIGTVVESEFVGVFRAAHKVTIEFGSVVTIGETLGAVEVMRLSSDVSAPVAGEVTAIFVQDGQPVEYGQPLFEIAPVAPEETENA